MKRWLTKVALAAIALVVCSGTLSAQGVKDLQLNVFSGYSGWSDKAFVVGAPQSVPPAAGTFNFTQAIRSGVRLNVYTSGHWGEEFFYSYERNSAHLFENLSPTPKAAALGVGVHNIGLSALYYLKADEKAQVRTFVSFGLGGTVYRGTEGSRAASAGPAAAFPGFTRSSSFAFNYGVGVKTRENKYWGVRADAKGFFSKAPAFHVPQESGDAATTVLPVAGGMLNVEFSGGLVFYLRK